MIIIVLAICYFLWVKNMYYNIDKTMSHNALFNIVIGGRGIGKTYSWKKKAIRDFIRRGEQFGYIRRYEDEIKLVKTTLFNDIIFNDEFPGYTISEKNGLYFVDDEIAGYAFSLTKAKDYKSSSFPLVKNLLYDEFLIEGGTTGAGGYLKNEPDKLLDLYETIARMRDVRLFMFANAITMANPYFLSWDINFNGRKTFRRGEILAQIIDATDEFVNKKESTRFGKIARDLGYANYSIDNKFMLDEPIKIAKKGKHTRYYCTLKYSGKYYGVWKDLDNSKVIISYSYDPCCTLLFDYDANKSAMQKIIDESKKHPYIKIIKKALLSDTLYYEQERIKHELTKILSYIV